MDYKQLQEINNTLKTTDIKGKAYTEVNQRILGFRQLYPNGTIETEILSNENGVCVMEAIIKDEEGKILAKGHAFETQGSSYINKTSYIENCETSAIGRALGVLGIGAETSIASKEEIEKVEDADIYKHNIFSCFHNMKLRNISIYHSPSVVYNKHGMIAKRGNLNEYICHTTDRPFCQDK